MDSVMSDETEQRKRRKKKRRRRKVEGSLRKESW
jgi:hypothetical protein